jgi:hypothetical protein
LIAPAVTAAAASPEGQATALANPPEPHQPVPQPKPNGNVVFTPIMPIADVALGPDPDDLPVEVLHPQAWPASSVVYRFRIVNNGPDKVSLKIRIASFLTPYAPADGPDKVVHYTTARFNLESKQWLDLPYTCDVLQNPSYYRCQKAMATVEDLIGIDPTFTNNNYTRMGPP